MTVANEGAQNMAEAINWRNLSLGVIGLTLIIIGNFLPPLLVQKELYMLGSVFLLTSSILEKHTFFVILQVVVLAGTIIAFAPIGAVFKAAVPIGLSIIAIIYFITQGMLKDLHSIVGIIGLVFLAAGYAISNPIIYLLGGFFLAIYSFISYRHGHKIGLIFFILNVVFTCTAGVAVYHMFQ